jgi:hydrogenase maturation protease
VSGAEIQKVAEAVLYEGYALYPYRASNVKNRQRWTFGGLYPEAYAPRTGDRSSFQAQMLVAGSSHPIVEVKVRFLHLVEELRDGQTWQTGMEREIEGSTAAPIQRFTFPAWDRMDDGVMQRQAQVDGMIEVLHEPIADGIEKLTLRVANVTDLVDSSGLSRDQASLQALVSAHAILRISGGEFVSLTDPPPPLRPFAGQCDNQGVWPVLAGDADSHDCMLVSPIILSDYPQVAPESAGDLFDGAEIDEILTLRILTMTDSEKDEMRQMDERTRQILERTENLSPSQLMQLHGVLRNPHALAGDAGNKV